MPKLYPKKKLEALTELAKKMSVLLRKGDYVQVSKDFANVLQYPRSKRGQ